MPKEWWIILLVLALVAVACVPANTANVDRLNGNPGQAAKIDDGPKQPKDGAYCDGSKEKHHPAAEKLSLAYDVSYEEIIGWYCKGYGFGEIDLAYRIGQEASVPVEEIFDRRASGLGWGEIMKAYGVSGKPPAEDGSGKQKDKVKDKGKNK